MEGHNQLRNYLSKKPVDVYRLRLAETKHAEDRLDVVGWIPRRVEDDDAVGALQVDSETTSPRRDQEETKPATKHYKLREINVILQMYSIGVI